MMKKNILWIVFFTISGLCIRVSYAQEEAPFVEPSSAKYTASELKDPFKDYITPTKAELGTTFPSGEEKSFKQPPLFNVQGIIWGGPLPMAIINNKVVKEGDILDEAKIIKIDKEGISFFYYGEEYKILAPRYLNLMEKEGGKQ